MPSVCLGLHEGGPGTPVVHDRVLDLWPRDLDADAAARGLPADGRQAAQAAPVLALQGVVTKQGPDGVRVDTGQAAAPVVPLLLDARADQDPVEAAPY